MKTPTSFPLLRGEIMALILLFSGIFFRVIRVDLAPEVLPNFSPLMAAALCGALFLPGIVGIALPVAALLISDAVLNLHYGEPMISSQLLWTLPGYLVAVGLGGALRGKNREGLGAGLLSILGNTLVASLFFYLVTNTGSWLGNTGYPQTPGGWIQALTTGLPGFPPTWSFLRNSLLSDLLFAALFVAVERSLAESKKSEAVVC